MVESSPRHSGEAPRTRRSPLMIDVHGQGNAWHAKRTGTNYKARSTLKKNSRITRRDWRVMLWDRGGGLLNAQSRADRELVERRESTCSSAFPWGHMDCINRAGRYCAQTCQVNDHYKRDDGEEGREYEMSRRCLILPPGSDNTLAVGQSQFALAIYYSNKRVYPSSLPADCLSCHKAFCHSK